jgi:predicted RNase H-like nuclease (RuvC/YqgF family)
MDKRALFDNIRKETNSALTKIFDKVEEVSKTSALRLKISSLKDQIKKCKREIGNFVYVNRTEFEQHQEINDQIIKITELQKMIEQKKNQIEDLKDKEIKVEEKELETEKVESDSFSI